ncbi:MAG TPA: HNH endonuclease, partial [Thalassospira sp.]|nr:HNH endonuclease [Thalassospira sp.]
MIAGDSVDRHHWTPKSKGGTDTQWLHRVCHRM